MKQCPYCNAQNDDKSKFCSECGKELPQENVCAYCGATVNEEDVYCEECGRNLKDGSYASSDYGKKLNYDYKKILISSLIGIVIGLIVLTIVGGSWYGFNEYSAYIAKKEARLKFVADSLEKARKDSIKLAEKKEKERIKAKKDSIDNANYEAFKKVFTAENVVKLLKDPKNAPLAQKCGLSLIIKEINKEEFQIVYGYGCEKGEKMRNDIGYAIENISKHACHIEWKKYDWILYFKSEKDGKSFYDDLKDNYGLYVITYVDDESDWTYIPTRKTGGGLHYVSESEIDFDTDVICRVKYDENLLFLYDK